jgi:hypothetical protein
MARREVQDRQFTIYFPSHEDLERWKGLSKPYTLNHWIMLMVEKAIKDKPIRTRDADEINALRKRNLELEQENESLTARLEKTKAKEVEALLEKAKGPIPLDKHVVDLLRSGGAWPSARIIKELTTEKEMATADGEDVNYRMLEVEEIPALYLSPSTKELSKPVIKFNRSERIKGIKRTLEQLEALNLVEYTRQGWKWHK